MIIAEPSSPGSGDVLLASLRSETRDLHQQLDDRVGRLSLATREGYVRFLMMHARVLPAAEAWLGRNEAFYAIPEARHRLRASELKSDLDSLGVDAPSSSNMSFLNENTSVLGICYVLEGSRLGGAYLSRMMARNNASFPLAFLRQGQERPLWKSFVGWLSVQHPSQAGAADAVNAAKDLFGAYLAALDESPA